jgi:hypothetical protein
MPTSAAKLRLLHFKRRALIKIRIHRCKKRQEVLASSLPSPSCSIWYHIYEKRDDDVFLLFLGIPCRPFFKMLRKFSHLYNKKPVNPAKPGRNKTIVAHQALAVVAMFYTSSADTKYVGLAHNLTPRRICDIIARVEPMFQAVLRTFPDARIEWPSLFSQREGAARIQSQFPLVPGRFGFVDGKNLTVLQPSDVDKQNAQYNGWLHSCFVTGILVFDTNGLLIYCKHNCPGSWNDGDMCVDLCYKLLDPCKTVDGHGLCADTAFPVGTDLMRRIVSPLKDGELEKIEPQLQSAALAVSAQITSLRQACEWGMGSIQKPFKRLTMELPWRDSVRAIRLENIFRLWNVRVRSTGISQINESFGGV